MTQLKRIKTFLDSVPIFGIPNLWRKARDESARVDEVERSIDAALGNGQPWPLVDVIRRLGDAAEHLLQDHACDAHGYEELRPAIEAARQYEKALRALNI